MSAEIPYWWRVTPQIWVVLLIAGFVPFLEQKIHGLFKDFQEHFSHFWRTPFSAKKSLESVFCSSSTTRVISSRQDFQGACEPCDLSCRMANLLQPIRSTTQIWVVMHHQFGNSVLVSQMSFHGETSGAWENSRRCNAYQRSQRNSIYFVT